MDSMNEIKFSINAQGLRGQLEELIRIVEQAYRGGEAVHEVEYKLFRQLMAIGHEALGLLFTLCGQGDRGDCVERPEERVLRRLEETHRREYQSIFGVFELIRVVYGSRDGQRIEYVPLDEQLQLPQSKFSYLLQDWDQSLAVESTYKQVDVVLERILGFSQSLNSLERGNAKLSASVEAYWEQRAPAPAAQGEELVVATADCKGVVMRKPSALADDEPQAGACKALECATLDSEKTVNKGCKKMAVLGSAYTIAPYVRTPEEVLEALFRARNTPPETEDIGLRPTPLSKHIRASLRRDDSDTLQPAHAEIFSWLAEEVEHRSPEGPVSTVLLMDGQKSLWNAAQAHLGSGSSIEILDLLHANSYVWKAAKLLHPNTKLEGLIFFVKPRIKRILHGEVEGVVQGLRAMGTRRGLKGKRLKKLNKACAYLHNNAHRMRYDEYLAAGYPIASGVIEGACRHVVKDRMERSGMRWTYSGAQSMLELRCIYINGDWEEYMRFHIKQESQRLYPWRAANDDNLTAQVA